MNLPELALQIGYGRIGWAVVASAIVIYWWPRARPLTYWHAGLVMLAAACAALLPGEASYAYWVGLACQYPSGLLVGCCLASIWWRVRGEPGRYRLPPVLAIVLAPVGLLLYLDAIGVFAQGSYFWGFGPALAPGAALLGMLACAGAIAMRGARVTTLALFMALALFTLLRLPSGNLWDSLLDPLLWIWSCAALVSLLRARLARGAVPLPAG
ncbi:hypothetical protein KY495_06615 [Massilia sp. PAMC28688]|uniref:hypothetical protein n=1 Tax=Massilia sp. PAMC28688 TaxID=2861283 RepID=UPI001C62C513|nr:hypothetical protein [Massilia sp. PAMC28688]QYF94851.1 hypothetical protein KY495_06615 [Massilia sp. PAMC28688]